MEHDVVERLAFELASENVVGLAFALVVAVAVAVLTLVERQPLVLELLAVAELVVAFVVDDSLGTDWNADVTEVIGFVLRVSGFVGLLW